MAQRRRRIVDGGGAVHVRDRAERRLAHGSAGDGEAGPFRERHAPDRGELHEQVVRVLAIDERLSVERLASLEQLAITLGANRRGVEAEHRRECQPPGGRRPAGHTHPPVRHDELVAAARAALMVVLGEQDAILHQHPFAGLRLRGRADAQRQAHTDEKREAQLVG